MSGHRPIGENNLRMRRREVSCLAARLPRSEVLKNAFEGEDQESQSGRLCLILHRLSKRLRLFVAWVFPVTEFGPASAFRLTDSLRQTGDERITDCTRSMHHPVRWGLALTKRYITVTVNTEKTGEAGRSWIRRGSSRESDLHQNPSSCFHPRGSEDRPPGRSAPGG
jgi:hypothetical protein